MTNFEKLNNMSKEDLAVFIGTLKSSSSFDDLVCKTCRYHSEYVDCIPIRLKGKCEFDTDEAAALDWLSREVEE